MRKQLHRNVTHGAEDRARQRLREHHRQELERSRDQDRGRTFSIGDLIQPRSGSEASMRTPERRLFPEAEFVERCIHVAKRQGIREAQWWRVAQHIKQWTRNQWDAAYAHDQLEQTRHWHARQELYA